MRSLPKRELEPVVSYFREQPGVAAVLLFGSTVRGRVAAWSDLDLAILLDSPVDSGKALKLRLEWAEQLGPQVSRPIDVVILQQVGPIVAHEILRTGKPLVVRDRDALSDFTRRTLLAYFDFKPTWERLARATVDSLRASRRAGGR